GSATFVPAGPGPQANASLNAIALANPSAYAAALVANMPYTGGPYPCMATIQINVSAGGPNWAHASVAVQDQLGILVEKDFPTDGNGIWIIPVTVRMAPPGPAF